LRKYVKAITVLAVCLFCGHVHAEWTLSGSSVLSGSRIILTPATQDQIGAAWANNRVDLSQDFDFSFYANFGTRDSDGADGIAFVFQNDPRETGALGSTGAGGEWIGLYGIYPAVAVEFDTYQNTARGDPSEDHIGINLMPANGSGLPIHSGAGPVRANRSSNNIEDGNDHLIRIRWTAATNRLRIYFNGSLRLTYNQDIVSAIFGGNPLVYWGFTASTGGAYNVQSVLVNTNITASKTATPENVDSGGTVNYTITLNNTGQLTAMVTQVQDTLPEGFSYAPGTTSGLTTGNPDINGQILTWHGSWTIPAGENRELVFNANAGSVSGTWFNNAVVSGENFPPFYTGDTAPVTVGAPLMELLKTVDRENAEPAEELTYAIHYMNTGDGEATNLVIMDTVPFNTAYVPGSLRAGAADSTYQTATVLTDNNDEDAGHITGSTIFFIIPSVAPDDGAPGSGGDEGKVYFKITVN